LYRARQRKGLRVFALGQRLRHFADRVTQSAGEANGERVRRWMALYQHLGAIKQKYANRHRAYQYIAESKRWESNDRQKERFCYRFNLTKGTDIATTFSIVKPTLQGFSSNLSPFVSGYGGLRTFV
jgi:hypothetical protein